MSFSAANVAYRAGTAKPRIAVSGKQNVHCNIAIVTIAAITTGWPMTVQSCKCVKLQAN